MPARRGRGFEHKEKGYKMRWDYDFSNNPMDKNAIDKTNKTPRTCTVVCNISKCIWWREAEDGKDNCGREEAWNIINAEEIEIEDNIFDCAWYSGRGWGPTLSSIASRTSKNR